MSPAAEKVQIGITIRSMFPSDAVKSVKFGSNEELKKHTKCIYYCTILYKNTFEVPILKCVHFMLCNSTSLYVKREIFYITLNSFYLTAGLTHFKQLNIRNMQSVYKLQVL